MTETKPEFFRYKDAQRLFGISPSTVKAWVRDNLVKSHLIKQRGNIKGIRVISYDSTKQFIEGQTI